MNRILRDRSNHGVHEIGSELSRRTYFGWVNRVNIAVRSIRSRLHFMAHAAFDQPCGRRRLHNALLPRSARVSIWAAHHQRPELRWHDVEPLTHLRRSGEAAPCSTGRSCGSMSTTISMRGRCDATEPRLMRRLVIRAARSARSVRLRHSRQLASARRLRGPAASDLLAMSRGDVQSDDTAAPSNLTRTLVGLARQSASPSAHSMDPSSGAVYVFRAKRADRAPLSSRLA